MKKKKEILKKALVMLLAALMVFFSVITAFAANGDVNVDAGGGTMEGIDPDGPSIWHIGDDGVRISLYQVSTDRILDTADFSLKTNYDFVK